MDYGLWIMFCFISVGGNYLLMSIVSGTCSKKTKSCFNSPESSGTNCAAQYAGINTNRQIKIIQLGCIQNN